MVEPTESYTKAELDRLRRSRPRDHPAGPRTPAAPALSAPHFTPIDRVDEVEANREVCLSEPLETLPL